MKILIAVDSSQYSEAAINEVIKRPWPADATVCAFSVVDVTRFGVIGTEGGQWTAALLEAAEQSVKTAVDQLKSRGLNATAKVTLGSPSAAICEYARDWDADFIFVGSHGRTGLARLLLGSVSRAVIHRAPCAVVVARPSAPEAGAKTGFAIVVAVDGSECSITAVRSVAQRKWPEGTRLSLISVGEVPDASLSTEYIDSQVIEQMREGAQTTAAKAVAAAKEILSGSSLAVTDQVIIGDPKSVILEEAERFKADLIVVGSHGRRGVNRILLGSVSEAVAAGAHCSVEIIR